MKGTFIDREEGGRDTQLIRRRDASSRGRGVWLGARRRRLGVGREDSAWIGDGQWKRRVVVRWSRSWGGAGRGFGASRGSSGSVVEVCRAEEVSARGSPETRGASGRQRGGRDLTVRDGVAADDQRHGKACVWCGTGMLPLLPQADLQGTGGGQSHAAMRGWAELQPPPQSRPEGRADLRFLNIGSHVAGQGSNVVLPLPAGGASPSCSPRHSCPLQMEESRRWARRETQGCQSCSASASRMTGGGVLQRSLCLAPRQLRQTKRGLAPSLHHQTAIIICPCQACATLSPSCSCSQLLGAEKRWHGEARPRQDRRNKDEGDANEPR